MLKPKSSLAVLFGLACAAAAQSHNAYALSPPWEILDSDMQKTIGAEECVDVDRLKPAPGHPGDYLLDIHVHCSDHKADALAKVLPPVRDFGGTQVFIRVFDPDGNLEHHGHEPLDPCLTYEVALRGNPLFVDVVPNPPLQRCNLVFKARVIQFLADNLADAFRNLNFTAQDAFELALDPEALGTRHIGVSTKPIHCGDDDDRCGKPN